MKIKLCRLAITIVVLTGLVSCVSTDRRGQTGPSYSVIAESDRFVILTLTEDTPPSFLAQVFLKDKARSGVIEDANKAKQFRAGDTVIIPKVPTNPGGLFENGYQTVPILCYHRFSRDCKSPLCMPEKNFIQQMTFLKENHFRVISMNMLTEYLDYKADLPEKSIVITVDDGYRSFYDIALPVLKRFGFPATLFIYTDFVGGGSALTWEQIREIRQAGFEIGSHTVSHSDLVERLDNETDADYQKRISDEIVRSKEILDAKLGQDTTLFAFPFGSSNQTAVNLLKSAGYRAGLTVNQGENPFFKDAFRLCRTQILSRDPAVFAGNLKTVHLVSLEYPSYE